LHIVDVVNAKPFEFQLHDFEEMPVEPLDQRDRLKVTVRHMSFFGFYHIGLLWLKYGAFDSSLVKIRTDADMGNGLTPRSFPTSPTRPPSRAHRARDSRTGREADLRNHRVRTFLDFFA
jgi:hypothetical protein